MTDSDFIALNLPAGVSFSRNGVIVAVVGLIDDVMTLPEVNGVKELALAILFQMLESDHLKSETIGKYSYDKWGMRGSDYWRLQAASVAMTNTPPNVALRPLRPASCGRTVWP